MHFRYARFIGAILIIVMVMLSFPVSAQEEDGTPKATTSQRNEELISIDTRDKSFAEIIEGIREETGQNIIFDEEIKDIYVTIRLIQVPWKKALEVIAKEQNCIVEDLGLGVIKVSKPPTVTMEFEGADIRDIINQIATIANKNIVISQQVKGTISLRLKNVPWMDALESIIKTRGYVMVTEKDGRIMRIVPPSQIQTQLETEIFKLRFVRPKSIYVARMSSPYFQTQRQRIGGSSGGGTRVNLSTFSLLDALTAVVTPRRGRITYDDNTNTLVITDTRPKLDKIGEIIKELDMEPKQVFLDIKFVRTRNSDIFDFGIDPGDSGIAISQSFGSLVTRMPFTLGSGGWEDEIAAVPQATLNAESGYDRGIPNDTHLATVTDPIEFGKLDFSSTNFTLRLVKRDVKSKIIQAPKIITLDNHEATIFVGRSVSFARSEIIQNDNGVPGVEMREAENSPAREGFQILVVPHVISGTNKIQLTIIPSNDQLTGTSSAAVAGFNNFRAGDSSIDLPETTQQVVVTHLILESGQTAVLGGLLQINQSETVNKIPLLGDIPLIGYFFKNKSVNKQKEDMYIFVTPRIVQSAEVTNKNIQADIKTKMKVQETKYKSIWQENKKK